MSETNSYPNPRADRTDAAVREDDLEQYRAEFDFSAVAAWVRRNNILAAGLVLIAANLIWKAQFLSHMYFSQDDFVNLDVAVTAPLSWHYLAMIEAGHFFPGGRMLDWVLARASLYDWRLAAGVSLALLAAASLAALRVLRTLFGNRLIILVPLAIYLLTPLTIPALGWWSGAIESLPLQLAIFMALNAHVLYVRTRSWHHLAAAVAWLVIGMFFFEKGFVLAPLLFAITAAFLTGARSFVGGLVRALGEYRWAWVVYGVIMAGYAVTVLSASRTSKLQFQAPSSVSAVLRFASTLLRDTLLTGALGGPWHWLPVGDGLQALASPPSFFVLVAALVAVAVILVSIVLRWAAWRAWAILIGWVICADVLPIVFGRLSGGLQSLAGLQTRYVSETASVLAICVGLAFFPVVGESEEHLPVRHDRARASGRERLAAIVDEQGQRYVLGALAAIFVIGSVWSVDAYESSTPGGQASRAYVANMTKAVQLAPRHLVVLDQFMPQNLVEGLFGKPEALQSSVIGDLARGKLIWVGNPSGTIDGLHMFGSDGRLYPALVYGVASVVRHESGFAGCWPQRHGRVVVRLQRKTNIYDWILHISYIWGSPPRSVLVGYGDTRQLLSIRRGTHNAYLPVHGDVTKFTVSGLGGDGICVGGSTSGELVAYGTAIP